MGGVPGKGARAQRLVILAPGGVPTRLTAVARLQSHIKIHLTICHIHPRSPNIQYCGFNVSRERQLGLAERNEAGAVVLKQ